MINQRSLIFLTLSMAFISWKGQGQYFQYSQYNFTEQRVNPAMVGLSRYASASLNYRQQKTGGDFNIHSNFISVTYPLLQRSTGQPWSGIGISLHDDRTAGIFQTQEVALAYALHLRAGRYQSLSFGAKVLAQTRKISYDGFFTGAQFIPGRGFDQSLSNGESFNTLTRSLATFSLGLHWQESDRRGRIRHAMGISLFDLNRPESSFVGTGAQLPTTAVASASAEAFHHDDIYVYPEAILTYSGSIALTGGLRVQKVLNPRSRGFVESVEVLAKYALTRSGILGIQLHREKISMGLSYDFPIFARNPSNYGAFELAIALRKLVETRSGIARKKKKKTGAVARNNRATPSPLRKEEKKRVDADTVGDEKTILEIAKASENANSPDSLLHEGDEVESRPEGHALAGNLKQEPLVLEHFTLHFAFDFNSSDIDEASETFLEGVAETLLENEHLKIRIEGHTDNIGSSHFNLRLSQKRADAVKHFLIKQGVPKERIVSIGRGMHEPLNNNESEEQRAENRRVELLVHY